MTEEQHDRVTELFGRAIELPPGARGRFVDGCSDDPVIRSELRSLLAAHQRMPDLLERMAGDVLPAALQAVAGKDIPERRPVTLESGSRVGSYEIRGRLAAGGIGIVYRAFDTTLQRPVAIKTLAWSTAEARHDLLREARAASALNHPHICTIYEVGEHDGIPFIAMEYIEGRPLRDVIPRDGLPAELMVRYAVQISAAVEHAHRHGVIHHDLKSANVIISPASRAKVLDFGLASRIPAADVETFTPSGVAEASPPEPLAGTLAYLAPELLRGGVADTRSDVWALGVLLVEMVSGKLPFQGATRFELTAAILGESLAPLSPKIPLSLRAVIGRCLARDPAQRYQHAGEVRVALETLQLGRDLVVPRDEVPAADAAVSRWRRRGTVIAAAVALMLATVALVVRSRTTRALALTERDTLLVADFINTTGDSVFDGTLRQALSIHLEQSPFFSLVSNEDVRETLRLMTRSPDERVTGDVARDACQRLGARATVTGSIAPLGGHFVVGLDAADCQSGETIGREQAEATRREDVLNVLGIAASRLRPKLGESRATVERFDVPIQRATTASLEAFKAFKAGEDLRERGRGLDAVASYKHAIELDPHFATAYARLSTIYGGQEQYAEMRRNIEEAYARRDRVSERERLYIEGRHCLIESDPDCYLNVHELWKRIYPRDPIPYANIAAEYLTQRGMCDKALDDASVELRLGPNAIFPYMHLAAAFECLGRYSDAKRTIENAFARGVESPMLHRIRYEIAFLDRDAVTMAAERQKVVGRAEESVLAEAESDAAASEGRMQRSRELRKQAEHLATGRLEERMLLIRARGALYEAAMGDVNRVRAIFRAIGDPPPTSALGVLSAAAVLSRDDRQADALLTRAQSGDAPPGRLITLVRVLHDVDHGGSPVDRLLPVDTRDLGLIQAFRPVYMRGLIYLRARDGAKAAGEFQRILDHRGAAPTSPLYPLAFLQQARAYVLMGDQVRARNAYQAFLALWKDADQDIPILREARTEYLLLGDSQNAGR